MDINCPNCGEPWDVYELHEAVAEGHYADVNDARRAFYRLGCTAMDGGVQPCSREGDSGTALVMQAAIELMGDDIDGIASFMDDYSGMG